MRRFSKTTGYFNTATGFEALFYNTGDANTADGVGALNRNTTGRYNTASGTDALAFNTTGNDNTANGGLALINNTSGSENTADGLDALHSNTSGNNNIASGYAALTGNTTGSNNIALGFQAGANLTTGSNNIDIGSAGIAGESGKIRIGTRGTQKDTFIAGIYGETIANGVEVQIDDRGHLGTRTSSARFKRGDQADGKGERSNPGA
ncbi:MAG: hypothetical protein H0X34_15850 [Chthoniobacterales bacterium]|nr:hypothetical protein [Chthoniobacterales bacterium]